MGLCSDDGRTLNRPRMGLPLASWMTETTQDAPAHSEGGGLYPRGVDRRARPTRRVSRYSFFGGRRKSIRREEERAGAFVDLYDLRSLWVLLWVAAMNAADSFFTIYHLQVGGIELNPVAAAMLDTGRIGFVLAKGVLISLALLVLCIHKNFLLARIGLGVAVGVYTALVGYHLWLL